MKVDRNLDTDITKLSQPQHIREMLVEFGMETCKPSPTPMVTGRKLSREGSPEFHNPSLYRSLVGTLLHLANTTRPDISFAGGVLSRFNSLPLVDHWIAAKRVMRYLSGTLHHGLVYRRNPDASCMVLQAFTDADWAGDTDTRVSTTGVCCILSGAPVSWLSQKQSTIALSSCEAEYVAAAAAAKEIIWLRRMLAELKHQQRGATPLYCDNQSTIALTKNPVLHSRSKHIDIRHHFIRQKVADGEITLEFVPSNKQLADIFTKPLSEASFFKLRLALGVSACWRIR